jgi:nucleoside-diphosphate-sugar epimerase
MKRVLVTGGAGYIGSVLVNQLVSKNYEVIVLDKLMHGGESLLNLWNNKQVKFHFIDITDTDKVNEIFKHYQKIDFVVHLAAIVGDPACKQNPDLAINVNKIASENLLDISMKNNVERFVFSSTCSNYGKMSKETEYVDENSPLAPVSLYAETKVNFEKILLNEMPQTNKFSPTVLRFATVYGMSPRMRFDLTVNEFSKELALGRELEVYGEQFWRPYCNVTDIGRAITTVLEAEHEKVAYNVFNVGDTSENYTKYMLVQEIKKFIPDAKVKFVKKEEDPRDYKVSFEKIKNELGFEITKTVPEGIKEVIEAVKSGVFFNPDDKRHRNI